MPADGLAVLGGDYFSPHGKVFAIQLVYLPQNIHNRHLIHYTWRQDCEVSLLKFTVRCECSAYVSVLLWAISRYSGPLVLTIGKSLWWAFLGLLSCWPTFKSNHCNSFEDWVPLYRGGCGKVGWWGGVGGVWGVGGCGGRGGVGGGGVGGWGWGVGVVGWGGGGGRGQTLGRLRSIYPDMFNHFASQSKTC